MAYKHAFKAATVISNGGKVRAKKKRINSRAKGKRIELEAAHLMTALTGEKFIRGAQHSGSPDSPDIRSLAPVSLYDRVHFEVKGDEKVDLWGALAQAHDDAGGKLPVIMHRKKNAVFIITMTVDSFISLVTKRWHDV